MEVNAQLIKSMRTKRSWTQQHLADACGISLRTVQRVERYGTASNETVMGLASVFEVLQNDFILPDEPVITIAPAPAPVNSDIDKKKLIVTTLTIGMVIGASMVLVMNALLN